MSRTHHEELIRQVEEQHARYIRSLRDYHDALAGHAPEDRSIGGRTPPLRPLQATSTFINELASFPPGSIRRQRRLTNETPERRPSNMKNTPASLQSLDIESSDDEDTPHLTPWQVTLGMSNDERICVQQPLTPYSFSDHDLWLHLHNADFGEASRTALDDVYQRRSEINLSNMFHVFNESHDKLYDSATYEVYEVGRDGNAEPKHAPEYNDTDVLLDARMVWDTIKRVNTEGNNVGRIISLQDPSPLMLGSLQMTMRSHFDMEEVFQHLVTMNENKGKTRAYMDRAFEPTELRQRSFFFVFKYYTVVGETFTPAPWQNYDHRPADKRSADHIDICECSSILALSLSGEPIRTFGRKKKKAKAALGKIYDPFASWQLLNIQFFPDDEHDMRNEDSRKNFCNGPYAFLDSLAMEYRDAVKRNVALNERITKLITPPVTFMFDARLRDKLLFEDKHFTYSRRYFWAYNTLAVINDGIKSMISAYTETFTKEFWAGRHQTLFPHPDFPVATTTAPQHGASFSSALTSAPTSPEFHAYVTRLQPLRHEIEVAIAQLRQVYDKNEGTRQEIKSLRDQLFSGSSVKESRRAIEQGDNIKLLTSLSMVFLPLTFVTSVWSMTGFPLDVDTWQFPATMICACVPFLLFVLLVQTRTGMDFLARGVERVSARLKTMLQALVATFRSGGGGGGGGGSGGRKRGAEHIVVTPPSPLTPPVNDAVAGPAGRKEAEAGGAPGPRRKKRGFSKRLADPNQLEDTIPADYCPQKKSWLWWRRAPKTTDGVV